MSVDEVRERIKQSLQKHFADLEKVTKHCIKEFSYQLYAKYLISEPVRDAPTCSKILDELQAGLEQMKYFTPLRMCYQKFLDCLSAQGGPSKGVSDQLREELEEIKQRYEEVLRGGERKKTDFVTNKQLSALLKQRDEKIEAMKIDFEARLKEKNEVMERLNAEAKQTQRLLQEKGGTKQGKAMEDEVTELSKKLQIEQQSKQKLVNELIKAKQQVDSLTANNERLQQSKQQLVNELTILREQVDTLTASKESLLTAYNQEQAMVTSLQQQLQRMRKESATMKKANEVLKDKVLILQQQPSSLTANPVISPHPIKIIARQNIITSAPPTGSYHLTPAQQDDGNAEIVLAKSQQVAPPPHSEQFDSLPDDAPLMSKEEMSRLFKWQDQQDDSGQATVTQTPQQVEDSLVKEQERQELAQKADEALREIEQVRKQPPRRTMLPHTSSKQEPVNQRQPKKKINQQQVAADDSDTDIEENVILEGIDDEIHEMAEEVRRMSRRPSVDEVLFDDEDSSLPYDPNLICPKCGRQYRVGGIQKFKRHIVEFCTGKR